MRFKTNYTESTPFDGLRLTPIRFPAASRFSLVDLAGLV